MLDLRLIREDPEGVRAALARRRAVDGALDEVLALDERWLELRPQIDELRATQNRASEKIAEAKRAGGDASEAIAEMQKVAAREEARFGTGFLPDTEQQIYRLPEDDLYLAGTSEVALASLHAGEILDEAELPRHYAGFSTCFRREAGAAGKDTRGIFRVHQFDKVEMFSFVVPEASADEHERLLAIEEEILRELDVPYRVVAIAAAELGASAAQKYDCEAWLPGQDRYRELTSCSNTTDFQARRLDIRYRGTDGKPVHVHTLNGTAVAVGRTIIALLENGQQDGGSVQLPKILGAYG